MASLKKWRRDRNWQRMRSPERSINIENSYDYKINRYQKSNWGDIEAKEAHASVVKYLWRKERELNKKKEELKKQISTQINICANNSANESNNSEVASTKSKNSILTKREIDAPMRGVHLRTIEDKTKDKLNLIKSERKLAENTSYLEKIRAKENKDIENDITEDLKNLIRGRTAYQISAALLGDSERKAREARRREMVKFIKEQPKRDIYEIMADRNELGITYSDNDLRHSLRELQSHRDHDYRWTNNSDYLNLVGYRMQNDIDSGCFMQNHGEIIWGPLQQNGNC